MEGEVLDVLGPTWVMAMSLVTLKRLDLIEVCNKLKSFGFRREATMLTISKNVNIAF